MGAAFARTPLVRTSVVPNRKARRDGVGGILFWVSYFIARVFIREERSGVSQSSMMQVDKVRRIAGYLLSNSNRLCIGWIIRLHRPAPQLYSSSSVQSAHRLWFAAVRDCHLGGRRLQVGGCVWLQAGARDRLITLCFKKGMINGSRQSQRAGGRDWCRYF